MVCGRRLLPRSSCQRVILPKQAAGSASQEMYRPLHSTRNEHYHVASVISSTLVVVELCSKARLDGAIFLELDILAIAIAIARIPG